MAESCARMLQTRARARDRPGFTVRSPASQRALTVTSLLRRTAPRRSFGHDVRECSHCPVPPGSGRDLVGVSPSGRFIVVHNEVVGVGTQPNTAGTITALDQQSHRSFSVPVGSFWSNLVVPSESEIVLVNGTGSWERHSLPDLGLVASGNVPVGAHGLFSAASQDGRFISYNNGSTEIPLYRTVESTSRYPEPDLWGGAPGGGSAEAMALSGDGKRTAIAKTGTIYISDTSAVDQAAPTLISLPGNSSINENGLSFIADNDHLLSASGNSVAVWDLTQLSIISPTKC